MTKTISKIALNILILLILCSIFFYLKQNKKSSSKKDEKVKINHSTKIYIKDMKQTFYKNNKKELILLSKTAAYFNKKNNIKLNDVKATFFNKNNEKIFLVCNEGFMDTQTKDFYALGNVDIEFNDKKFQSEKVSYNPNKKEIFSDQSPVLFYDNFKIVSKKIKIDINKETVEMEGDVEVKSIN